MAGHSPVCVVIRKYVTYSMALEIHEPSSKTNLMDIDVFIASKILPHMWFVMFLMKYQYHDCLLNIKQNFHIC